MNTNQLQCAISCDVYMKNNVLGVFAADKIPKTLRNQSGFITNTDPHQKPGKHWLAFFYDNEVLECFDSYGLSPEHYSQSFKSLTTNFSKLKVNTKRIQSRDTAVCGQYCLFYLMCKTRGYTMEQVVDIFNNNYRLNDQFVYNFIDKRFHCCMSYSSYVYQICICENKM